MAEVATLESVTLQLKALDDKLTNHIEDEMGLFREAFPDGDAAGHRKAHEAMIEAAQAQAKFWTELRNDLAKKTILGLFFMVIGLVMVGGAVTVAAKLGLSTGVIRP